MLAQTADSYDIRIQKFIPGLYKCLDKGGVYVNIWLKVCVMSFSLDLVKKIFLKYSIAFVSLLSESPT